jgi:hypothetical protein
MEGILIFEFRFSIDWGPTRTGQCHVRSALRLRCGLVAAFVAGSTSISIPICRAVAGVAGREEGEGVLADDATAFRLRNSFVTAGVTPLLRVCYGFGVNFAPHLPRCYGCYGSRGGKGVLPARGTENRSHPLERAPAESLSLRIPMPANRRLVFISVH